ncbi:olfactory receptor 146-like isoform X1 [Puntigrus tetrazona]|uniref:olfactory receptor 146-like isoform X1 n=1 Tax=Puntigrus tetrazona TaxID=1606681 RepID=UPI001C8A5200|nr:olfactory receptor 146-like isoform X1 [Puntigrus tetrazona]
MKVKSLCFTAHRFCVEQLMDNLTFTNNILLVEGLKVTPQASYLVFILLFLFYVLAMGCNIGLIILIAIEKNLHHPMHFLFCNLPVNDIIGTTVILPRLMQDIFKQSSERYITYAECIIQAYFVHIFATASHTALVTMAYDRQVAICNPLLYMTIMTNKMVVTLSALAWALPVIAVAIMIGLTVRLSHCRSKIENPFCDNASLYKLSCENVAINNMFGIVYSVAGFSISVTLMLITYIRIATVCIIRKNKALNSKAIKTCGSHITVYLIMFVSCAIMIFFHRFPEYSENRKLASIMFHIVPPGLNPVVYGLQTTEIRQRIVKLWRKKVNIL